VPSFPAAANFAKAFQTRLKRRLVRLHALGADALHAPLRRKDLDDFFKVYPQFVELVAGMDAPTLLELGSRNVTGATQRHLFPDVGRYIGCDIHPGEGVDLVADIHALSQAVAPGSVDAVMSVSVFEHLAFPWKAVLEINRVLKPGGYVFVSTHPAWPAHELPWDFWRFPVAGLVHLLGPVTGFEVVSAAEGLPAKIYSLSDDPPTRGLRDFHVNLGVAVIARKVADCDPERLRWDVDTATAVTGEYPRPA
jgi:SAM-dependent methyltransferase